MKTAIIGFSRPSGFFKPFSWAIRLAEWTPYSHVYIRSHSDSLDLDMIYQASGLQVNFMGLAQFKSKEIILDEFQVDLSDDKYKAYLQWAVINAGADYSVKQILGIVLVKLFNLKVNPFANGQKAWICAELVEFFLDNFVGINLNKNEFETAGPNRIYQICEQYTKKLEVQNG